MRLIPERKTILAAGVASFVTFVVMASTRPAPTRYVAADGTLMPAAPLNRMIDHLRLRKTPLSDAIVQLARKTGISMMIDVNGLHAAGIDETAFVDVDLSNVSTAKALDDILASAQTTFPCGYWLEESTVKVGAKEDEVTKLVTRIYDVETILQQIAAAAGPFGKGLTGGISPPTLSDTPDPAGRMSMMEAIDSLSWLIEDNVVSDSWKDNGGSIGSIRFLYGRMIVIQTARNQQAIEATLSPVSAARAGAAAERDRIAQSQHPPADDAAMKNVPTIALESPRNGRAVF